MAVDNDYYTNIYRADKYYFSLYVILNSQFIYKIISNHSAVDCEWSLLGNIKKWILKLESDNLIDLEHGGRYYITISEYMPELILCFMKFYSVLFLNFYEYHSESICRWCTCSFQKWIKKFNSCEFTITKLINKIMFRSPIFL